jgi:hypothetical protein
MDGMNCRTTRSGGAEAVLVCSGGRTRMADASLATTTVTTTHCTIRVALCASCSGSRPL